MNLLLVSGSFITREGLKNVFKEIMDISDMVLKNSINQLQESELLNTDFMLLDIEGESGSVAEGIAYVRDIAKSAKLIILDRNKNMELFKKSISQGVDGYIVNIEEKEDFIYYVKNILKGKKIYDPNLTQLIISQSDDEEEKEVENRAISSLTKREKEVLYKVSEGLDNRSIAKSLNVTEYTIKKHTKSIFDKLGLKNRKEIIVYMHSN